MSRTCRWSTVPLSPPEPDPSDPFGAALRAWDSSLRLDGPLGGGNRNERIMYTDGRAQKGQLRGDDDNPLYYGRAVAEWKGDTLTSDIKGFNEKFWFDNGGLPHTDQLHLVERFTRTDMNTLKYEVTIDDPGAYTKQWVASWTLQWITDEELPYFLCEDNRP